MLVPVRCFSCGKVVGHLYDKYRNGVSDGQEPSEVFSNLGISRYCCRRSIVSTVDLIDEIKHFR